ncbi:hypothetical protein pipiens_006629 [Culex pipiens pipiens]|uniref:Uncharacterized protein n=1 Tax=Culex pipiens pipiens TaxID=38569 RepID=A0ABD1DPQ6_CULPP
MCTNLAAVDWSPVLTCTNVNDAVTQFGIIVRLHLQRLTPRRRPPQSIDWNFYQPEKQNDLLINDPNHIFYIINDPQEVDCLTVRLLVHVTGVVLHVYCRIDDDSRPVPIGLEPTPAEQQPTCFKRNAYRLCGVNTSERLRMTLLRDRELLLLEDFSDGVPKGSWLLLQKDTRTKNGPCKCPRWERMVENYEKCFDEHDKE